MKQYYIYKITNKINKKMYIGSHYGEVGDSYYGSGLLISRALEKHGKENFIKEILEILPNKQIMLQRENYWLNKFNCAIDSQYYNITNAASGGHLIDGKTKEEQKAIFAKRTATRKLQQDQHTYKMVQSRKNWSEKRKQEFKKTCSLASKKKWAAMSSEQKANRLQKIVETKKNQPLWKKKLISKKHSELSKKWWNTLTPEQIKEHGKKISQKTKGKIRSETVKQKIRDGVKQYYLNMSETDKKSKS